MPNTLYLRCGEGAYDEGEEAYTKEQRINYNDTEADLVIYPEVGEVRSSGESIDITAKTITAGSDFRAKGNGDIRLTAEGDIRINGTTLDSTGSKATISITSTDGRIFASNTTMSLNTNNGQIELSSNGDIYLESADLSAGSYTADLTNSTATLYVDGLSLTGGNVLTYDPDDITVIPDDGRTAQ